MRINNKTVDDAQINAVATATLPAPGTDRRLRAVLIAATVSAGAAVLTVDLGGGVTFTLDVTPGGGVFLQPEGGFQSQAPNAPITASLSAAGASNTGRVVITGYPE